MPHAVAKDGTRLYYEEAGSGTPLVFVHEFAGDHRSWEPQMRFFARYFRCVAFNARGFPPSDVPEDGARYSQAHARDDIVAVLDHLRLDKAHLVGLSMGGFAVLHAGITHPGRARSLVIGGCGYGAEPDQKAKFQAECDAAAASFEANWSEAAKKYALGPTRVQFQNKDPRGWGEFAGLLAEHSSTGSALTMLGVQRRRPSLYELVDRMQRLTVPTLVVTGDEDEPCLEPGLLMKRTIKTAGLVVIPNSGHTINLEEPAAFNRCCDDFFHQVETGRWPARDPRATTEASIARAFHASKRHLRFVMNGRAINMAHSRLELLRDPQGPRNIAAEHGGAQAIFGVIRQAYRLGLVSGTHDGRHGPKGFLGVDLHCRCHPIQDGRSKRIIRMNDRDPFHADGKKTVNLLACFIEVRCANVQHVMMEWFIEQLRAGEQPNQRDFAGFR